MIAKIYVDDDLETLVFEDESGRKVPLSELNVDLVCDPDDGTLRIKQIEEI